MNPIRMNHMMKRLMLLSFVLSLPVPAAVAQQTPPPRAAMLRRELEQRFAAQMREQLQLTGDQETKVRSIMSGYAAKRRGLEDDERAMRQALNGQLRPGIAANADSVARLVDAIAAARVGVKATHSQQPDASSTSTR